MKSPAGSYGAVDPESARREALRLDRQAAAIWDREREALLRAGLAPGQRFLDVGCGPGGVLRRVSEDLGRVPFGIDLSQELAVRARAAGHSVRADGAALPFASGTFDFVLLRLVLRHVPAPALLLRQAARVARAGGKVCVVDVDESATAFDPEPASWPALKNALAVTAIRRGGDPYLGRRARSLLLEAGLVEPHTAVLPVTTEDLSRAAFVDVMLAPSARAIDPDLLSPADAARAWEDLRRGSPDGGFGYALGFMVAASKPDGWGA